MESAEAQAFRILTAEILAKIRRDREQAPPPIQPLLAQIEEKLFSPSLTARELYRACSIRDRWISAFFRHVMGLSPWRYIESRRLEAATGLLAETQIKISRIALLLGYASLKVFSNAFLRCLGERPMMHRKRARVLRLATQLASEEQGREIANLNKLRQALAGSLDRPEAVALMRHLQSLYPDVQVAPKEQPPPKHPTRSVFNAWSTSLLLQRNAVPAGSETDTGS